MSIPIWQIRRFERNGTKLWTWQNGWKISPIENNSTGLARMKVEGILVDKDDNNVTTGLIERCSDTWDNGGN